MTDLEKLFYSFNYHPKLIPHMTRWLQYYFTFAKFNNLCEGSIECLKKYSAYLKRKYEPWQVQQAEEAAKIYLFANDESVKIPYSGGTETIWKELHKIGLKKEDQ